MSTPNQLMAEIVRSAEMHAAIIGRPPLAHVILIKNRSVISAWRTGEQRARE
jgi:hypothetical protein